MQELFFKTEYAKESIELQVFGSPGGKTHIVKKLLRLVPKHKTYVEPFAGGAALYWKKELVELEVLNDLDSEIAFAYNFIKNVTEDQVNKLNSMDWHGNKERFFRLRDSKVPSKPTERFYRFYYVHYHSYGGSRKSYGYKDMVPSDFKKLLKEKERLKRTKIFSSNANKVIKKFDSENTFIYLDPPYPGEWPGHTGIDAWGEKEVKELYNVLKDCKSKWLLSINSLPWIIKIFSSFKINKILVPRKFKKGDKPKYELLISNYNTSELSESINFKGLVLSKPFAEKIWMGGCKKIKIPKSYKRKVGENLYYMDNENCYGILRLEKLSGKDIYNIEIIDRFEDPKSVEVPKGKVFLEDTNFLQTTTSISVRGSPMEGFSLAPSWIWGKKKKKGKEEKLPTVEIIKLIQDIKKYDPTIPNNNQLAEDWRTVNGWYVTYKETEGEGIKFSKEVIINLAKLIYNEIQKRVKAGDMQHKFQHMKPECEELYKIVSGESILAEWGNLKFLDSFDDFVAIKDCISLIGSTVTQEHKPNDIDLLVRMEEPKSQFLKRAIETRLSKMLPEELQGKLHFVWGEKEGPHDSFIPLFDLQFRRIRPVKMITMIQDNSSEIQLMKPFIPMKPYGSAIYDLDKFIDILI